MTNCCEILGNPTTIKLEPNNEGVYHIFNQTYGHVVFVLEDLRLLVPPATDLVVKYPGPWQLKKEIAFMIPDSGDKAQ